MKFLIINGPNINMLGIREKNIYGEGSYQSLLELVQKTCQCLGIECECFQSNHEGELIDEIHASQGVYDGIVYNPGAHTHYSYALHDAISSVTTPVVEVHISDISKREEFRRHSVLADACIGQIKGLGPEGYLRGVDMLLEAIQSP